MNSESRRQKLWMSCGRKVNRFLHEGQARREAFRRGLGVYLCRFCERWHLTSKHRESDRTLAAKHPEGT